jgi:hypothetical protein
MARLNNIWYTQQVESIHIINPAGFVRYLDDIWPGEFDIWVTQLHRMEQETIYLNIILTLIDLQDCDKKSGKVKAISISNLTRLNNI